MIQLKHMQSTTEMVAEVHATGPHSLVRRSTPLVLATFKDPLVRALN